MTQQILVDCGIYKLLEVRKSNVAKMLSGILVAVEPEVNRTLECIKAQFPGFTEHGIHLMQWLWITVINTSEN